jgi:hypothetical protein
MTEIQFLEKNNRTCMLRKEHITLTTDYYKHPKTVPLIFHFDALQSVPRSLNIKTISIGKRDLYIIDHFFSDEEVDLLRTYSKTARFSRLIYTNDEAQKNGEIPARAMDNKEKWEFFFSPPTPILEFYKLLGSLAYHMDAEIITFPWDLCHETLSASAVATNYLERVSEENQDVGKHQDCNSEAGVAFGIPLLYGNGVHPNSFINGDLGRPWLISAILYSTAENFHPDYGMGTLFYTNNGEIAYRSACFPSRLVFFEGDILHSIEASKHPPELNTWRVSYVFKLIVNPRKAGVALKKNFSSILG